MKARGNLVKETEYKQYKYYSSSAEQKREINGDARTDYRNEPLNSNNVEPSKRAVLLFCKPALNNDQCLIIHHPTIFL